MKNNHHLLNTLGYAFIIAALSPVAALAQESQSQLDDVVVTATRHEQSVLDVPISISALNQKDMDERGVKSINDIVRLTPGLSFSRSARSDRQGAVISLRGISSSAGSATVGVYIDETPVQVRPVATNSSNPYPRVFDLDRVEVLRGPQGTLFGVGSEGGTVRFISPQPSLTTSSLYSRAEVSSTDHGGISSEFGVAGGAPIVEDKLGFRGAVWARRDAGFVDRVDVHNTRVVEEDSNWNDALSARVAMAWRPTQNLTITPSVFYQKTRVGDTSQFFENYSSSNDFRNGNPIAQPGSDQFTLPSLKVDWELGDVLFVSNTSWLDRKTSSIVDSTFLDAATLGGFNTLPPPAPLDQATSTGTIASRDRSFVQEIRLQNNQPNARLNWVVGAFYQRTTQSQRFAIINPFIDAFIQANPAFAFLGPNRTAQQLFGVPLYNGVYLLDSETRAHDEQVAAFGQLDFKATDRLTLTGGVRVADTKFDSVGFGAGPVLRTSGRTTILGQEAKPVTPKVSASYDLSEESRIYASAAKGFRIGGATSALPASCTGDAAAIGLSLNPRQIAPDSVWSYEIGSKNRLNDGRVQLSGSAFYVDWQNIQSALTLANCNVPTTANLGAARSQGFDLQLDALLGEATTVNLGIGYTDAQFTQTSLGAINPATGQPGVIRSAGQPLGTPPWTVSFSVQQSFSLMGQKAYVRGDYQYQSKDNTALDLAAGADPTIGRPPALNNLDLRAGVQLEHLDISAFVSNVTNELPRYGTYRETLSTAIYHSVTVRPRTLGVTATYRY